MQSRLRKLIKSSEDAEAIQKQLNNNFEVYEFLKENKLESNNIDSYVKLLNTILVQKQNKKQKLETAGLFLHKIKDSQNQYKSEIKSNSHSFANEISHFTQNYNNILNNTSNELEIQSNLEKEIIETKKSLNLLKGDIGHLVSRNQSAKLISSKIAKVKIVADDQFKRVNMAFSKDKEEIKMRNQMQKKFSKKLKNMSNYQASTLIKIKKNYAESVLKRKQIFDKLNYIEKVGFSIEQYGDLYRQKNQKNISNIVMYESLVRLHKVIKHFSIQEGSESQLHKFNDVKQLVQAIKDYSKSLEEQCSVNELLLQTDIYENTINFEDRMEEISQQKLVKLSEQILRQYERIVTSIKHHSEIYSEQMEKKQQYTLKLGDLENEQQQVLNRFQLDVVQRYRIASSSLREYNQNLKRYQSLLKTYYSLFQYISKNIDYTCTQKHKQYCKTESNQNVESQDRIQSEESTHYNNFVCQLHQNYQMLAKQYKKEQQEEFINIFDTEIFFDSIGRSVTNWLLIIKDKIFDHAHQNQNYHRKNSKQLATTYSMHKLSNRPSKIRHDKSDSKNTVFEEDEIKDEERFYENNYLKYHSTHQEESAANQKSIVNYSRLKNISLKGGEGQTQSESVIKAQRIKLLQDVDKDYYKILKNTIKMQKQNTRKNYQFLRTFKRAKYSSRDDILEEKRFEASFSVLFTNQTKNMSKETRYDNLPSAFLPRDETERNIKSSHQSRFQSKGHSKYRQHKENIESKFGKTQQSKLKKQMMPFSQIEALQKKCRLTQKLKIGLSYAV